MRGELGIVGKCGYGRGCQKFVEDIGTWGRSCTLDEVGSGARGGGGLGESEKGL